MLAKGYRPKGKDQHRTVIEFVDIVLGAEFKNLVSGFDRMRRRRDRLWKLSSLALSLLV